MTANGLSAELYEHTKLDGLDARMLHTHLADAILATPASEPVNSEPPFAACTVRKHSWKPSQAVLQRIEHVTETCRSYGPLDHQVLNIAPLSQASLRSARSPPNATAHLTVLLALYLLDGEIRPAWEKVSLGTFARGRVEWVQTMSPAARAFVEAAAAKQPSEETRGLLNEAAAVHSRTMLNASQGRGAVGPLYALLAAAQQRQQREGGELPELFKTHAWTSTRRGGPGQEVKVGFMRFQPDETEGDDNGEAGFLVPGERGVYVHCNVREESARFAVSGKTSYVAGVCEALQRAADLVAASLKGSNIL